MNSIQTNVNSLIAQENLQVTNTFQTKTIEQLTSGYRINSSSDDAAGLAVANQYRDQTAELTQGVRNANDGTSQLQIMDGGLNNISQMLDRLQTLATESASSTFTGDRTTLNTEYQGLLTEIDRQADNVGLGTNNSTNLRNVSIYIGGGQDANTNSSVNVGLSNSGVGATALGLAQTSVLTNAAVKVGTVVATAVTTGTAQFTVSTTTGVQTINVNTANAGTTLQSQMGYLNSKLRADGITASLNDAGQLQFTSASAFSVSANSGDTAATNLVNNSTTPDVANNSGLNSILYTIATPAGVGPGPVNNIQLTVDGTPVTINLGAANEVAAPTAAQMTGMVNTINDALKTAGITNVSAVADATTMAAGLPVAISFQGTAGFTLADDSANSAAGDNFSAAGVGSAAGVSAAPTSIGTGTNPQTAIDAISAALASLGSTQGKVGAAENTVNYAVNLAQSQITNFSSAESQIRDADIASEAANLSKAQVLQQSSMAAMAQANSAPQAVLKLLQ